MSDAAKSTEGVSEEQRKEQLTAVETAVDRFELVKNYLDDRDAKCSGAILTPR